LIQKAADAAQGEIHVMKEKVIANLQKRGEVTIIMKIAKGILFVGAIIARNLIKITTKEMIAVRSVHHQQHQHQQHQHQDAALPQVPVLKGKGIVTLFMIVEGILFVGTIVRSLVVFTIQEIPAASNQGAKVVTFEEVEDAAPLKILVMKGKVIVRHQRMAEVTITIKTAKGILFVAAIIAIENLRVISTKEMTAARSHHQE